MPPTADAQTDRSYRGRFAPTPSGPLHLGSLLTALASYLQARSNRGVWLLRFDDLDQQRCPPGTDTLILQQLEQHGLQWDEAPRYQQHHIDDYTDALATLEQHARIYACSCTRARLKQSAQHGDDGLIYDGHCRFLKRPRDYNALRIDTTRSGTLQFVDRWQGVQNRDMPSDIGDYVLRRADGIYGYQLSCAVDEAGQRISEVVRGADLLASTFQQLLLIDTLTPDRPTYCHLGVVCDDSGRKLSKQNHATSIDQTPPSANLTQCLRWLNQSPPSDLSTYRPTEILHWAITHWRPEAVAPTSVLVVEGIA